MFNNHCLPTITTSQLSLLNSLSFLEDLSLKKASWGESNYNTSVLENNLKFNECKNTLDLINIEPLANNLNIGDYKKTIKYSSTKILELGSCAFRQWRANHSHCRFLHGYQLKAKFWFESNTLDDKNWVVDFGGLKNLEKTLKNQFDHTLCIAKDDPLLSLFEFISYKGGCNLRVMDGVGIEKIAEWCLKAAESFLTTYASNKARVKKVEVFEHENNSAVAEASDFYYL
jgi:6-pyruvoyltetrahydropterin/6-carboxytetrahydropterin synthase